MSFKKALKKQARKMPVIRSDLAIEDWKHTRVEQYVQHKMLEKDPCSYCGEKKRKMTIDHIRPRSSGHGRYIMNKTAACEDCNTRKGSKSVLEFMLAR